MFFDLQPGVLTLHSCTEMNCRMFSQCSARGWEFKKVLVLGDAKADDWNIFVYIYLYMFIYIHTYMCMHTQCFKNKQPVNTYWDYILQRRKKRI